MIQLDKLKQINNELTEEEKGLYDKIIKLEELIRKRNHGVEYDVGHNLISKGISLLNRDDIAIQIASFPKGGVFGTHSHKNEKEILILIKGCIEVGHCHKKLFSTEINKKRLKYKSILSEGDCIKIESGELHYCKALEDSEVVGITIPASEGYP